MHTALGLQPALIGNIGPTELILILLILVLLFGATKLPQLSRSLGRSIREFKAEMKAGEEEDAQKSRAKDQKDDA